MSKFWKPGTSGPGQDLEMDRDTQQEGGKQYVFNPNTKLSLEHQRQRLPIFQLRNNLLYYIEKHQVVIVIAETGAGKTTQIPQYLYETGWGKVGMIGCTQPRRVAVLSVAQRVSEEKQCEIGGLVGYNIRFDDMCSDETRIKFMTDGMLVREMMLDPLLSKYSVIMVDEAHERSLHTDIIIGLLKKIIKKRSDLHLIISSATLQARDFKSFFETNDTKDSTKDTCTIVSIQGRMFPVEIYYLSEPKQNYVQAAFDTVINIDKNEPPGDILVFLTGQEEIENLVNLIQEHTTKHRSGLLPLPLFSGLHISEQMRIFEPVVKGLRKVVISTNIAEASVTIDNIVYVVDCGFVKQKSYDPNSDVEKLIVTEISQSSAIQRAGRAGRTRSGKCFRLYTQDAYNNVLKTNMVPEIQRINLAPVIIQLKALGIDNILKFNFLSPPPIETISRSLELLYSLGAIDENSKLTNPLGVQIAEFPVDPKLAKMLLVSGEMYCSEEAVIIASMLTVQTVFSTSRTNQDRVEKAKHKFAVTEGDHLMLLNLFKAFQNQRNRSQWCYDHFVDFKAMTRVLKVKQQLTGFMKKFKVPMRSCGENSEIIRKCIMTGYFSNIAQKKGDGSYFETVRGKQKLFIHPTSSVFQYPPEWVLYSEVIQTQKQYMRDVMSIDPKWLTEIAPHFYEFRESDKMKRSKQ
jgi:ATP-dependent RNA helicase DDX35